MGNHSGNQKPAEMLRGHWTKAQLEERKAKELKVEKLKEVPRCPSHLNKEQKSIYKKVCKQLIEVGLLTELDIDIIIQYSITLDMYQKITKQINENPELLLDDKLVNKQLKLLNECRKCQNLLCLNPISRAKIVVNNNVEEKKPENKFLKFVVKDSDANE